MSVFINKFLKCYLTNLFIILTIVLGLLSTIYNKKIIGWFREHWTKKVLNKLPKDKYIIINNVFIATKSGAYQIDHVIVSKYGIFSIETK